MSQVRATTIIMTITSKGIIIGADSLAVKTHGRAAFAGRDEIAKIAIIKNRMVIACLDTCRIDSQAGKTIWDFQAWIRVVEKDLHDDISIDDFLPIFEAESAVKLAESPITQSISRAPKPPSDGQCAPFVQFLTIGYQDAVPKAFLIQYYINWESKRLLAAQKSVEYPIPGVPANYGTKVFGIKAALTHIENPKSYAYKLAARIAPQELKALLSGKTLTINQAISLTNTLMQIEKNISPNYVGGDTAIVFVPLIGKADFIPNKKPRLRAERAGQQ